MAASTQITPNELLAVGRTLAGLPEGPMVTGLSLDGRSVDPGAARVAYQEAVDRLAGEGHKPGYFEQVAERFEAKIDKMREKAQSSSIGRSADAAIAGGAPRVSHKALLAMTLGTGEVVERKIPVMDFVWSRRIAELNLATDLASLLIPVAGHLARPIVGVLAAFAAAVVPEHDLSWGLRRVAQRELRLTLPMLVPGVDIAVGTVAAAESNRAVRELGEAPPPLPAVA